MSDTGWLQRIAQLGEVPKLVVEKVSNAIGMVYEPTHVRRMAAAEGDRMRTLATAEADVTDIRTRAALRQQAEQVRYQQAIEEITIRALPHLTEQADPAKVDDDWLRQFFGKAREVSNGDMRALWARILAGEFNRPGTFSRRTLGVVDDLDKRLAETFSTLCRFALQDGQARLPVVWGNLTDQIYAGAGLSYTALAELDSVGLLRLEAANGFYVAVVAPNLTFDYFGKGAAFVLPAHLNNQLPIGSVMLTRAGTELATICESTAVAGFLEHAASMWIRLGVVMSLVDGPKPA